MGITPVAPQHRAQLWIMSGSRRRCRSRFIPVAQPKPVHRIWQALLMAAERRQVEIMVGGIHHVEAAREAGIGVEDLALVAAIKHADAGRFLHAEAAGAEIIDLGARSDFFRRKRDGVIVVEIRSGAKVYN